MLRGSLALVLGLGLAGCGAPRPAVKIALVAPFEGRQSEVGYAVFPAFRATLMAWAEVPRPGQPDVLFVAYSDDADPAKAEHVARAVALDPEVVVVIGHLDPATSRAASVTYRQAGLAQLDVCATAGQAHCAPTMDDAEKSALAAIARSAAKGGVSRAAVAAQLGLSPAR